jgi:hypothetical protein
MNSRSKMIRGLKKSINLLTTIKRVTNYLTKMMTTMEMTLTMNSITTTHLPPNPTYNLTPPPTINVTNLSLLL